MTVSTKYTAIIDIQEITIREDRGTGRGDDKTFRDTHEVTKLVVRADTLEALTTKVAAHLQIISS